MQPPDRFHRLLEALAALEAWGSARDWRGSDPVALARIVSAYARYRFLPTEEAPSKLADAIRELEGLRSPDRAEPWWGNAVATSLAGLALLDAFETSGDQRLLELAEGAGDFLMRHLTPTDACALLARLAHHLDRDDFRDAASAGVAYSAGRQRADGSWPSGERADLGSADSLQTGFLLESLCVCAESGIAVNAESVARGLDHYRERFFGEDGRPRRHESSAHPVDVRCAAQGIQTFARCAAFDAGSEEAAWTVFGYALRKLRRRNGAFGSQRRRLWPRRPPDTGQAGASMLLAMTHLFERARGISRP